MISLKGWRYEILIEQKKVSSRREDVQQKKNLKKIIFSARRTFFVSLMCISSSAENRNGLMKNSLTLWRPRNFNTLLFYSQRDSIVIIQRHFHFLFNFAWKADWVCTQILARVSDCPLFLCLFIFIVFVCLFAQPYSYLEY